jgi:hypothetical protein
VRAAPEIGASLGGVASAIRAFIAGLALRCHRHAFIATLCVLSFGGVGAYYASRLELDPDIAEWLGPVAAGSPRAR